MLVDVKNLVVADQGGRRLIDDMSFSIREGEVVGIAGVEGNGQSELSEVLSGMKSYSQGTVVINGMNIHGKSVRETGKTDWHIFQRTGWSSDVRAPSLLRRNIIADRFRKKEFRNSIFLNEKKINQEVDGYIREFEIACDDRDQPVRMLSGGNIQKVVVAREFTSGANVILANQPTRGIDVGTAEMIRKTLLRKVREENVGVLLVSADLNEVLEVSDRLFVMRKGKIVAAFPRANQVSKEELGEYMLGLKVMTNEEMAGVI